MRDVSGREVTFFGPHLTGYLRNEMHASGMGYALHMVRLRREAAARRASLQRQLDSAEAGWERAGSQISGWYGIDGKPEAA